MHIKVNPETSGCSALACQIAHRVLDMAAFTPLWKAERWTSDYQPDHFAADVARAVDSELKAHSAPSLGR